MSRYASSTSVPVEKSRAEIERILQRYGADEFAYAVRPGEAWLGFTVKDRSVRFVLPLPDKNDRKFTHTEGRDLERSSTKAYAAWEQACRQAWRALALVIKAKLEAVEAGITTFEKEFLAHLVLPGGQTIAEAILPQLEQVYQTKGTPLLLPELASPRRGKK